MVHQWLTISEGDVIQSSHYYRVITDTKFGDDATFSCGKSSVQNRRTTSIPRRSQGHSFRRIFGRKTLRYIALI